MEPNELERLNRKTKDKINYANIILIIILIILILVIIGLILYIFTYKGIINFDIFR